MRETMAGQNYSNTIRNDKKNEDSTAKNTSDAVKEKCRIRGFRKKFTLSMEEDRRCEIDGIGQFLFERRIRRHHDGHDVDSWSGDDFLHRLPVPVFHEYRTGSSRIRRNVRKSRGRVMKSVPVQVQVLVLALLSMCTVHFSTPLGACTALSIPVAVRSPLLLIQTQNIQSRSWHLHATRTNEENSKNVKTNHDIHASGKDDGKKVPVDNFSYPDRISNPSAENHRCGYVSLVGAPNMGKSTLLNALLGERLCVATHRPQTTRHAILGILNADGANNDIDNGNEKEHYPCQILFLDTPGIIDAPAYKLQEGMMEAVQGAFHDSDVLLVVTDLFSTPIPDDDLFEKVRYLSASKRKNVIVAVNKIDLVDRISESGAMARLQDRTGTPVAADRKEDETARLYRRTITVAEAVRNWRELLPDALAIVPLSADNGGDDVGVQALRTLLVGGPDVPRAFRELGRPIEGMFQPGMKTVTDGQARELLPLCPPLYHPDSLTDRTERFFCSEIVRATLFQKLGKELPYCCEVRIDRFQEPKPDDATKHAIIRIGATILVERDSQKGIVVGKGGSKIKEVGVAARVELEEFLQGKVHLELNVKVDKNWRRDESKLKAFGYLK